MLWGLLKREEQKAERLKPVPRTLTPIADSALRPPKVAPDSDSQRCASTPTPKRRRRPAPVGSLYPQPELEPLVHAKTLLRQIQLHAEDVVGTYIPQSHLQRF